MPAWKTSKNFSTVRRFDVLALCDSQDKDFPTHLMLCNEPTQRDDVVSASPLLITHMMPPLRKDDKTPVEMVGNPGLSVEQEKIIEVFLQERFDEIKEVKLRNRSFKRRDQYRIHPAFTKPNKDCAYWRFSCVGFVLATYEEAGLFLLSAKIPKKNLDELKALYCNSDLDDEQFRKDMGIGDGTEWPILFGGYVLNALNESPAKIKSPRRFAPRAGDEFFPSRHGGGKFSSVVQAFKPK